MSASKKLIQASAGVGGGDFYPYTIDNSVRFNYADSPKLTKTFSTPTNDKKFVFSTWFKMSKISNHNQIFTAGTSVNNYAFIAVGSADYFWYYEHVSGAQISLRTLGKKIFRDPSAWYHIVVAVDTTQATSTDRVKVYFNGELYTDWEATQSNYGTQNYTPVLCASNPHSIGVGTADYTADYVDGYLSQTSFIDGTAYTASDFGESKNGVWVPKNVSGLTFGNNGFYLDFSNSGALGTDVSGNGNNFTVSGLTSSDQMIDTPTNNFATFNPLMVEGGGPGLLSDGNLHVDPPVSGDYDWSLLTRPIDIENELIYIEVTVGTEGAGTVGLSCGITKDGVAPVLGEYVGEAATSYGILETGSGTSSLRNNSVSSATTGDITTGTVLGFAIGNGSIWFSIDGTWVGTGSPNPSTNTDPQYTGLTGKYWFGVSLYSAPYGWPLDVNVGQESYTYTPPTDFLALSTANLPEPTIGPNSTILTSEVFEPILYTGNGTSQSISTLDFQPDFTWIKNRDAADNHMVFDAVRGATKYLSSNAANTEVTDAQTLSSFNTNGFSVGNNVAVNTNAEDYVAWNWKANGSGSSNTDGDITSIVSANQDAGISIVAYTGNASYGQTVGHGLGAAPQVVICKNLVNVRNWRSYFETLGATKYINLDESGAAGTYGSWNNTAPTSTVFSTTDAPSADRATNFNGDNFVAYCFAEVEGFSSFGSYTGNGSVDGPFIFTGHRPSFVIVKRTDSISGGEWKIIDTKRMPYNWTCNILFTDSSSAENTTELESTVGTDILSNGFKIRASHVAFNASGGNYIYIAFAENPFKYSNAR